MFEGTSVALVTPFNNGKVDEQKLEWLVEFHLSKGTNFLMPTGTTGESATLTHDEHKLVMEIVVDAAGGRVPVVPGTGSNNTAEAVELTRHAEKVGANGALLITPYYNRPTQAGLIAHFKEVAQSVKIPLVLYNVPTRTGVNMLPQTVAELSKVKNVVAIKEASGSLDQISELMTLCDIEVLSGDDTLTFPIMALGGRGVVSVAANFIPDEVGEMVRATLAGDFTKAREKHRALFPLFKAMFFETNPIPVKKTMELMDMMSGEMRLPLVPIQKENEEKLRAVLRQYNLI